MLPLVAGTGKHLVLPSAGDAQQFYRVRWWRICGGGGRPRERFRGWLKRRLPSRPTPCDAKRLRVWKPATQQVWKPALQLLPTVP